MFSLSFTICNAPKKVGGGLVFFLCQFNFEIKSTVAALMADIDLMKSYPERRNNSSPWPVVPLWSRKGDMFFANCNLAKFGA